MHGISSRVLRGLLRCLPGDDSYGAPIAEGFAAGQAWSGSRLVPKHAWSKVRADSGHEIFAGAPAVVRSAARRCVCPGQFGHVRHVGARFRDPDVPQCYAISQPVAVRGKRHYRAYADIAFWPKRGIRGQVHVRLSRDVAPGSAIVLRLGVRRFRLTGGARDAWASDRRMDAAIAAAFAFPWQNHGRHGD